MLPQVYPTGAAGTFSAKDPNDTDFFQVDFSLLLAAYGDQINQTPSISYSPSGSLGIFGITYTTGTSGLVGFYASGGANNTNYIVSIDVTTNLLPSGRVLNRSVILPIMSR